MWLISNWTLCIIISKKLMITENVQSSAQSAFDFYIIYEQIKKKFQNWPMRYSTDDSHFLGKKSSMLTNWYMKSWIFFLNLICKNYINIIFCDTESKDFFGIQANANHITSDFKCFKYCINEFKNWNSTLRF